MYRCELCGEISPPRMPAYRLAVETRACHHPKRLNALTEPSGKDGKTRLSLRKRRHKETDVGGLGTAIVKEQLICPGCFERHFKGRSLHDLE